MYLTRESIKQLILPSSNIPPPIPQLGIKTLHQNILRRHGITPIIRLLRNTRHIAHGALVKFTHCLILKHITAFDLTSRLVGLAIARVDADDIGKTVGVQDTFGEGHATLVEEAEADGGSVGGVGGGWLEGTRDGKRGE
jgi:hypothetical protein